MADKGAGAGPQESSREKQAGDGGGAVRLNRYIAMSGLCSRREADALIEAGRVRVDGRPGEAGERVGPWQQVLVDGRQIRPAETVTVLAFNKPVGVVCTTDRRWGDVLLEDMVQTGQRLFPMGRLDKDSEGLLLLTNDGDLSERVMRGRNRHEKEYLVDVDRKVTGAFLEQMAGGVWLEELGVATRPCRTEQTGPRSFRIVLTQGLNRQIRRMCLALGYHVRRLQRVRIMNVRLGELKTGEYRPLTPEEIAGLGGTKRENIQGKKA